MKTTKFNHIWRREGPYILAVVIALVLPAVAGAQKVKEVEVVNFPILPAVQDVEVTNFPNPPAVQDVDIKNLPEVQDVFVTNPSDPAASAVQLISGRFFCDLWDATHMTRRVSLRRFEGTLLVELERVPAIHPVAECQADLDALANLLAPVCNVYIRSAGNLTELEWACHGEGSDMRAIEVQIQEAAFP